MTSTSTASELGWPDPLPVPATMRAMLFRRFGPPDVLEQATIDTPRPGPGEVLVQVAAVGIGRLLDLTARAGNHPYATAPGFAGRVREATGGHGIDIAVDNLGDPGIWDTTLDTLAHGGTVVTSGAFLGGNVHVNLRSVYSGCHRIIGVRTGNAAATKELWTQVEKGFRAVVDRTFPIARAADAHRYMEHDNSLGRVTLTLGAGDWNS